jgi:hypothetical protein
MAAITLHAPTDAATAWSEALQAWRTALFLADQASEHEAKACEAFQATTPDDGSLLAKIRKAFLYEPAEQILRTCNLDERWSDFVAGQNKVWYSPNPEARKASVRSLLDEIAAFRSAVEEADKATGRSLASDRYDKAWDLEHQTRCKLMAMPAPDAEAVHLKMEMLFGPKEWDGDDFSPSWSADYIMPALNDVKRFLAMAA